jgi:hypothetical protein
LASIMLVAFALRALIPAGFMLGGDRPFSIEICWDGFPATMLAQGESRHAGSMDMDAMDMGATQGGHQHSASEHCVFGSACSAGPIPHLALPSDFSSARRLPAIEFASIAGTVHLVHLPQSRAPPGQLS